MLLANSEFTRVAIEMGVDRKRAFLAKCVVEGRSMTDIIQEMVDDYISKKPRKRACDKSKLYVPRSGAGVPFEKPYIDRSILNGPKQAGQSKK